MDKKKMIYFSSAHTFWNTEAKNFSNERNEDGKVNGRTGNLKEGSLAKQISSKWWKTF